MLTTEQQTVIANFRKDSSLNADSLISYNLMQYIMSTKKIDVITPAIPAVTNAAVRIIYTMVGDEKLREFTPQYVHYLQQKLRNMAGEEGIHVTMDMFEDAIVASLQDMAAFRKEANMKRRLAAEEEDKNMRSRTIDPEYQKRMQEVISLFEGK